jgi:hypothetical protein
LKPASGSGSRVWRIVEGVVAIDGKTARGSRDGHHTALRTISAYATASGLCLARESTRGKEIENSLHWVLDATFREDDCRVRKGQAPQNFSTLRKFALTLLRNDATYPKRSLRGRRDTADRLPDYRASLLGLFPRRRRRSP